MSTGARLGILAGIIAVAILALVIAGGGSDDDNNSSSSSTTAATPAQSTGPGTSTAAPKPAGPKTFTLVVANAKPAGGIKKVDVKKGDQVRIVVKSDTADEVHLHGYDIHKDVTAGGSVTFNFKATIDGGFEMELESRKEQIAELTVEP